MSISQVYQKHHCKNFIINNLWLLHSPSVEKVNKPVNQMHIKNIIVYVITNSLTMEKKKEKKKIFKT